MGRYIAIEGVMGVGKTTLLNIIRKQILIPCVEQDFKHNICLDDFYAGFNCAFSKQMIFLLSNYHILAKANALFDIFISDYCFERSMIMSKEILNEDELIKFENVYYYLLPKLSLNKMLIILYGSPEKIIRQIYTRGRSNEMNICIDSIRKQQSALINNIKNIDAEQFVWINIDNINIMDPKFVDYIVKVITSYLKRKT